MLRVLHALVFALAAVFVIASGAHALGSETALRKNFELARDGVGTLALEALGTRQQNLSHATAVASECSYAARGIPALMKGPGGKMLGEAVGHLRNLPGAQRVGAFEKFAAQITEATKGQWSAKSFNAVNARVFAGEGGEALVFDAAGNMFRGNLADRAAFAFREGGQIEVIFNALKGL
jgi:hypothetical protein